MTDTAPTDKVTAESARRQERQERQRIFRNAASLKRKIREAFDAGQVRKASQSTRSYFRSINARTASVLKVSPDIDLVVARDIAHRVDPFRKDWPEIRWYPHSKTSGNGWRPVCMFSIAHQATLKMIADVLSAQWHRPTNLYGAASADPDDNNVGRDAAANRVHDLLERGFSYVGTADIKNAFGSVDLDALFQRSSKLPLHNVITRNAIDTRNQRFKEVPPPEKLSAQKTHVGNSTSGEEHVWPEYTLGLWDNEEANDVVGDPILENVLQHDTRSRVNQARSFTDRNTEDDEVQSRCINEDPCRQTARTQNNHAPCRREVADTRSQDVTEDLYHSSGLGSFSTPIDTDPIHSDPRPYGLAQGSATSPIIFAMLLGELPNATDDARFLVCHDDIIVLARSPEARSSMINKLRDYFANQSPAGSLTMETKCLSDNSNFEWLGYTFDPGQVKSAARSIGVGDRSYNRLLVQLNRAEALDIADLEKFGQNRASNRPCGYPLRVWHTLRQWRGGCGAVHPQHENLMELIDFLGSGWVAVRYGKAMRNPDVLRLHEVLFATTKNPCGSTLEERNRLRSILKNFRWSERYNCAPFAR